MRGGKRKRRLYHVANASPPSSEPAVAPHVAMPIRFHSSHSSSSFGMIASAPVTASMQGARKLLGRCGGPSIPPTVLAGLRCANADATEPIFPSACFSRRRRQQGPLPRPPRATARAPRRDRSRHRDCRRRCGRASAPSCDAGCRASGSGCTTGHVRPVGPDQHGGQPARLLQHAVLVLASRRHLQPVMDMQFRFDLAGLGIGPLAAACHHHRRRTEHRFQLRPCCRRRLVALGRQHQALGQILFARTLAVGERRDRRAEHDLLAVRSPPAPHRGRPGRSGHRDCR